MKLLLDTHILLWSLLEASRLTKRVAAELENASNELWVSPLSVWEIITLAEKGRVILEPDPITWIRKVFSTVPLKEALLNNEIAIRSRRVALAYKDPVDRFLAATAVVYDLTLVTADERLLRSQDFATLPNA
ncbi:type II toxin-antitoxin system VapC family toxin [Nitrospiraceae bacterium AH_259_D15_M11_P09]|nr:type II toxin-antitoxin system VapC family toxin [Nitrospiraceae bacterium AH_259_D15_M11_P09]